MAEPAERRPRRRWWPWSRRALPRSKGALAIGALLAMVVAVLLLLGVSRSRPSRELPLYDPTATTVTAPSGPVPAPVLTAAAVLTQPAPPAPKPPTTRRHR